MHSRPSGEGSGMKNQPLSLGEWTVWILQAEEVQKMEFKGWMLALGLQLGPFELVSEDNPHSLFFSLDIFGSVLNS